MRLFSGIFVCVPLKIGYNHYMKTPRTHRIVLLLIVALVFSPFLSFNASHAMMQEAPDDQIPTKSVSTSSKCHQGSESHECKHCSAASHVSCQHQSGDTCDNSCGHSVVSPAMTSQVFNHAFYHQQNQVTLQQHAISIILDTDLRPPQNT